MSPEYAIGGLFSEKSDVYSFGVMVLEIISGKKNTSFYDPNRVLNLLGYVSTTHEYIDPFIASKLLVFY